MRYNRKFCTLALLMILSMSSGLVGNTQDLETDLSSSEEVSAQKIKANKETFEKAQASYDNKDFQTTIELLSGYINSKPKKYEVYKLRGDAYYQLRLYALAQRDYETAIKLKSEDDKLITSTKYVTAVVLGADKDEQLQNDELGNLYARLMYAQKAQNNPAYATSYENAIKYNSHIYLPKPKKSDIALINCPQKYGKPLNPTGADEFIYKAINDIEYEKYSEALYKLQNITSEYPDYYFLYYLNGVALSGLEKYEEAQISFQKAIELNPNDFESYASLGQIYFYKAETTFLPDDAKKSNEYFNNALKYNPDCYIYYFYIGMNHLQMGNNDLAISNFNKSLSLNANDYNSMYYKSIAQFNIQDYELVIDGATALLYKHVSNMNSVLYLRALAYYKLGLEDKSISDLETIQNNIGDIYNADVKVISDKEKTLESYLHYLKVNMAHSYGYGAASDLDKAMANPIIALLSKAQNSIAPYEKSLNEEHISLEDYNKFEAFYKTSLPKILNSGIVITEKDVDNQYDYIRTTFSDIGLSLIYQNPDYKFSIIEDYPYKKYSSKLSKQDLDIVNSKTKEDVKNSVVQKIHPELKQKTSNIDKIGDNSQNSLASMLATNELINKVETTKNTNSVPVKTEEIKSSNIADGEPFVAEDKNSLVNDGNTKKIEQIIEEEKVEDLINEEKSKSDKIIASVPEIKQATESIVSPSEDKNAKKISEKHADVNPQDYEVQTKPTPQITEDDEVVVLAPKSLIKKEEIKDEKPAQDNSMSFEELIKSYGKEDIDIPKVNINEDEVVEKAEETSQKAVDVVIVPELKESEVPVSSTKEVISENIQTETNNSQVPLLRPRETEVEELISVAEEKNSEVKEQVSVVKEQITENIKQVSDNNEEIIEDRPTLEDIKAFEKAKADIEKKTLKEEQAKAKAQAKAKELEQKALDKAKKLQLKQERAKALEEAKAKELEQKALDKAKKLQLKQERAEALAQAKAQKLEQKAQQKAEKEVKKAEKALQDSEKKVSDKKERKHFSLKEFIQNMKSDNKKDVSIPPKKTVIKSLEK